MKVWVDRLGIVSALQGKHSDGRSCWGVGGSVRPSESSWEGVGSGLTGIAGGFQEW